MQQKINEELVQQVREGRLAIIPADAETNKKVLDYIFEFHSWSGILDHQSEPKSVYWVDGHGNKRCYPSDLPSRPVSDFFLPAQPLRIEDVTDKQVIHCETEEQMNALFKVLDEAGFTWNTGKSHTGTPASWYKEGFCINPTQGTHATLCFYSEMGYEILPASLFLQPPTEKADKQKTYRVTREQLGKIATDTEEYECYCESFATRFQYHESAREFTEMEVKDIFHFHGSKDFCKQLFPDFNPTPHIPKGEFAWVRDTDHEEWLCKMSAGNGEFYRFQNGTTPTHTWKQVRKYEDRPF